MRELFHDRHRVSGKAEEIIVERKRNARRLARMGREFIRKCLMVESRASLAITGPQVCGLVQDLIRTSSSKFVANGGANQKIESPPKM